MPSWFQCELEADFAKKLRDRSFFESIRKYREQDGQFVDRRDECPRCHGYPCICSETGYHAVEKKTRKKNNRHV